MGVSWAAWERDLWTWAWIVWIAAFVVLETWTLWRHPGQELTAHLRPLMLSHPLTWWLALGLWLWLGVHFLAPAWERRLLDIVTGG